MALITDPDQLNQTTEVDIDTGARTITLNLAGNLSADGVTGQAHYSFWKEEWKTDPALIKFPFPLISVTPEQFEWTQNWKPGDEATRKLLRTCGWREIDQNGVIEREESGVVSLGDFEDEINDTAYYRSGTDPTLNDTTDFTYNGSVNEAIKIFEELGNPATCNFATTSTITRASGSFITDGYVVGGEVVVRAATTPANDGSYVLTAVAALTLTVTGTPFTVEVDTLAQLGFSYRNATSLFLRIRDGDTNGKTYGQSQLSNIGFTAIDNKVFRWGLGSKTDLNILETDANIDANTPYTQIDIKYLDADFNLDVDLLATPRAFGVVIDVGTHSGKDGSATASGTVLTSTDGSIHTSNYNGGTLTLHDGADALDTFTIVSTTATTITISGGTFTTTQSNTSFTAQRSTPISATKKQIFEKIQRELRQTTDINYITSLGDVIGKVADEILENVGDIMNCGSLTPSNPNGGGNGVIIMGFDANDTNNLTFTDNVPIERTFPFVAAGNLTFNANLVSDPGPAEYFLFFTYTEQVAVSDMAFSGVSGVTASLDSAGSNLPTMVQNDYIRIGGSASSNNGLWQVTDAAPTALQADVTKIFPVGGVDDPANETAFAGTLDENPVDSADAIIVQDNGATNIEGNVTTGSIAFDFDYDNNVQGGRAAAADAAVTLRAIGLDLAQFIDNTGTISRATGLTIGVVASLERNYENL